MYSLAFLLLDTFEIMLEECILSGILKDEIIEVEAKENSTLSKLKLRKIVFYGRKYKREFEFKTNLFDLRPRFLLFNYSFPNNSSKLRLSFLVGRPCLLCLFPVLYTKAED